MVDMSPAPTIAIYFSDAQPLGYPFHKHQYFDMYREIIAAIERRGIQVFIVRGNSYLQDGRFRTGWRFVDGSLQETKQEVRADLIFNRDDKGTIPVIQDCPIINQPAFDALCTDKVKTHALFPDISPKTASIASFEQCLACIGAWKMHEQELIVLKKNFETEGRGIHILPVSRVEKSLYDDWEDVLLQEYLDGSDGIPGITDGLHDLRVTVVNGVPINSFLRTPKPGSYLANISQGGSGFSIDLSKIPRAVMDLVTRISAHVDQYLPALFAADFLHSSKGWKLLELNSRPGIQHPDWSADYKRFNDAVVDMLVQAVQR